MDAVKIVKTTHLALSELKPFPGNARRGNLDKIRESVKKYGQYRSILVREVDGAYVVVAGNHTAQAMREEGFESARCEIIECSDKTAVAVNLADNRLSDLGAYDDEALAELLDGLGGDFEATGYSQDDLDELMQTLGYDEPTAPVGSDRPEPVEPLIGTTGDSMPSGPSEIRETVLMLKNDENDELHLNLVKIRSMIAESTNMTNGEVVLVASRALKLGLDVQRTHGDGCICETCVLVSAAVRQ